MESQTPVDRKSHEKIIRIYNALKREDDTIIRNLLQTEGDINYKTPETSVGVADILQVALNRRQPQLFELLLRYRADFTRKDNEGTTALLKIIEDNAVTELLIRKKFQDDRMNLVLDAHFKFDNPTNPNDKNGITHFHAACIADNPSVVEFFVQNKVDINQAINADSPVFPSDTGLHLAVRNTCENVVNTLLYYKANTLLKNAEGYSPLHLVVEDYLRKPKLGDKYESFLRFSIRDLNRVDDFDFSKLHVACILQDQFTLRSVFEDEVTRINQVVSLDSPVCPGYSALHFAACSNILILKLLLFKGANINVKNAKGETPFDLCLQNYSVKDIHSTLMLQEKWRSIVLSDTETKLVNVVSAMENMEEFTSFMNVTKLALTSFVPWNSPLWPGYTLLHLAVVLSRKIFDPEVHYLQQKEDTKIIVECLKRGADVTVADTMGSTVLHVAFYTQKLCVAKCLLDHHDEATNPVDKHNLSHFHIACAAGHRKAVDHFLSNYVNVDLPVLSTFENWDFYICPGSTALHISVATGEVEIAKKLLKHGADVNARDANGFTPIHRLLFSRAFRREGNIFLSVLDLKNVTTNCGLGYLHVACYFNHAGAVDKLLKLGADINARLPDDFDRITKEYRNYPNNSKFVIPNFAGNTPLHFAFEGDADCEIVFMLIERGADIFAKNAKGSSLLEIWLKMSKYDDNHFSRVMLNEKARCTQVRLEKEFGITKLHLACFLDDFISMKKMIGPGVDVNAKVYSKSPMWRGCTPLHLVVKRMLESNDENMKEIIRLLIESGADPLVADDNNDTPFHFINLDNTLESQSVISILFENLKNYNINPTNNQGLSLFHIACMTGNAVAIENFLKQGVDVNQAIRYTSKWHLGSTPLNLLIEYHPLLRFSSSSWCGCNDEIFLKILDELLERGADVNAAEALIDETPLMKLVTFHRVTKLREYEGGVIGLRPILMKKLISNGADVQATNARGNTAFELLLRQGNASWKEVELFLEAGCHFNAFNSVSRKGYLGEAFVLQRNNESQTNGLITNQFQKIMNNAKITKIDNAGRTAVHNVVSVNDFETEHDEIKRPYTEHDSGSFNKVYAELIEELSIRGCDIDHEDSEGKTALHYAATFANNAAILGLLKSGADINITDKHGITPFAYCSQPRLYHGHSRDKIERAMKLFAMHIYKLEFCDIYVNKQNKQLQVEVLKSYPFVKTFLDRFRNEIQNSKRIQIGTTSLLLYDFLKQPDVDFTYMNMSSEERQEMDQFFQKIGEHNFLEIECLLKLKYRQSIERIKLMEPAVKSLNTLIKYQLPDKCCQMILKYLKNEDLKYLIASLTRKLERQGRVVIKC